MGAGHSAPAPSLRMSSKPISVNGKPATARVYVLTKDGLKPAAHASTSTTTDALLKCKLAEALERILFLEAMNDDLVNQVASLQVALDSLTPAAGAIGAV